jgi:hypothetical protein
MFLQLRNVTAHGAPAFDLAKVVFVAAAGIIAAIPLEPAARIVRMNPTFLPPNLEWLRRVDAEIIQRRTMSILRKLRAFEPACRKFVATIGHVFSAEDTEREHLLRRQLGFELGAEFAAHRLAAEIDVALLHLVVHHYALRSHSLGRAVLDFGDLRGASVFKRDATAEISGEQRFA